MGVLATGKTSFGFFCGRRGSGICGFIWGRCKGEVEIANFKKDNTARINLEPCGKLVSTYHCRTFKPGCFSHYWLKYPDMWKGSSHKKFVITYSNLASIYFDRKNEGHLSNCTTAASQYSLIACQTPLRRIVDCCELFIITNHKRTHPWVPQTAGAIRVPGTFLRTCSMARLSYSRQRPRVSLDGTRGPLCHF